ncbi:hypothetical protein BJ165DRAFT_1482601 [Panaeolus papilionaceus]|nr:hypothetical protein BJ165DRAFT_1482601 [Panaeolus papilionaceus]
MKTREDGGVVDERLNVYGVEGLKVASERRFSSLNFLVHWFNIVYTDCSIFPANVGGTIYNTALGMGEKAAVLIAGDLNF